jgi:oligoendopeptidase F
MACQIAGPALLELRVWNWIYANPKSTAAELRDRVLLEAERLWAEHYAEHFGPDPYRILAAYQHMINHPLYLADYPLGQIISHQIRSHLRGKDLAAETIRICSTGSVTPDLWMRKAVGAGISAEPLIRDAGAGLGRLGRKTS